MSTGTPTAIKCAAANTPILKPSFLEVKHKTRKDRTIKDRIPTAQPVMEMNHEAENWLQTVYPFDCRSLEPKTLEHLYPHHPGEQVSAASG